MFDLINTAMDKSTGDRGGQIGPAQPWQEGWVTAGDRAIPRVSTRLTGRDTLGSWQMRWGIGRLRYAIPPGLYAVGDPHTFSPVLVSANYKLSFDQLRAQLSGLDLWLLILDTKGVNVWCAAGKGTFGTAEVIRQVQETRLADVVMHRTLILPQLGAPGVTVREVKEATGFRPLFGPIRAADIPAYLAVRMEATPEMRRVQFTLRDRLVLTPVEMMMSGKVLLPLFAIIFLLAFFAPAPFSWPSLWRQLWRDIWPFLAAALLGTVLVPLLLPWIPGRFFAWKGWLAGFLLWLILLAGGHFSVSGGWLLAAAYLGLLPALSAWLAFNFTGCTTFTSLSGVDREMRLILVPLIVSAGLGALLLAAGRILPFLAR